MDSEDDSDDKDFRLLQWQSMSDMFMTFFVVTISLVPILWYISIPKHPVQTEPNPAEAEGIKLAEIRTPVNRLRVELDIHELSNNEKAPQVIQGLNETVDEAVESIKELKQKLAGYEAEKKAEDEAGKLPKPPDPKEKLAEFLNANQGSLDIHEGGAYRFESNEANISPEWLTSLGKNEFKAASDEVDRLSAGSAFRYSTLLIVGHTDGQPVGQKSVDQKRLIDKALYGIIARKDDASLSDLKPGSNFDLGMMRALAVADAWRKFAEGRKELEAINIRCLSAGATMPADESVLQSKEAFEGKCDASRRVEMKLILQKL